MKRLVLFMMAVMLLSITVNAQKKGGKTLVAYFSATGTTARAAKLVAEAVDVTLYEIQPAKKYTAADLDWHDKASRSSVEYYFLYRLERIWRYLAGMMISQIILMMVKNGGELLFGVYTING